MVATGVQPQTSAKTGTSNPFTPSFTRGGGTPAAGGPDSTHGTHRTARYLQDLPPRRNRRARAQGHLAVDRPRRDGRADGGVRLRQDHPDEHPRLPGPADLRRVLARRPRRWRGCRPTSGPWCATTSSVSSSRTSTCCRGPAPCENVVMPLLLRGRPSLRAPRPGSQARKVLWTASAWRTGWTTSRRSCPAASSSGWPSPGRWSTVRRWSSPTSRPATSIRTPASRSCGCSSELNEQGASPSSS